MSTQNWDFTIIDTEHSAEHGPKLVKVTQGTTEVPVAELPEHVRQYFNLKEVAGSYYLNDFPGQTVAEVAASLSQDSEIKTILADGRLEGVTAIPVPPTPPPNVVDFDVDEATYVGDGSEGVYYQVAEGPDGWYLTTVVDTEKGAYVGTMSDNDGPYESEEAANFAGRDAAITWCIDNEVNYEGEEAEEDGEEDQPAL
jgi:hypothetical protein